VGFENNEIDLLVSMLRRVNVDLSDGGACWPLSPRRAIINEPTLHLSPQEAGRGDES